MSNRSHAGNRGLRALLSGALAGAALAAALTLGTTTAEAHAIERIKSPAGIEAWLVRDESVPLIALDFAFTGGANEDPVGKPGVANMVSELLDEGAGKYDSKAFHERLEERAIQLGFSASRDTFRGSLRTLRGQEDEAFEMLRLSLSEARFDSEAVERVRRQLISGLRRETTSPNDLANQRWWTTAFPTHAYGLPVRGTLESVPAIEGEDLKAYVKRVFARENLKIAVVGDIDAAAAGKLIDHVFGALPEKAVLAKVDPIVLQGLGRRIVVDVDVPQAVLTLGRPGIARKDPDFMTAVICNHILGGGSFSSRLYTEVREKRGLAYGVRSSLFWLDHAALFTVATATRADRAGEALDVIDQEIRRMAEEGPTEEEFAKAKSYLKGSYALAFDTSSKIASQLVQIQLDDLGIDYIEKRSAMIDAITLADAKRVSKRLLDGGLLTVVAGKPVGVTSSADR